MRQHRPFFNREGRDVGVTPAQITPEVWKAGGPCGPAVVQRLSDAGGLTQFGVLLEVLPPGSRSSIAHWHAAEDEFVHVLSGTVDLYEGGRITPATP